MQKAPPAFTEIRVGPYSAFKAALERNEFFSRCGGPYPRDSVVEPIDWEKARDIIGDTIMSPWSSKSLLEERRYAARRRSKYRKNDPWYSKLLSLLDISEMCYERRRCHRVIITAVNDAVEDNSPSKVFEESFAKTYTCEFLMNLCDIVQADRLQEYPMLRLAGQIAFAGYIPVDISEESEANNEKLLIY